MHCRDSPCLNVLNFPFASPPLWEKQPLAKWTQLLVKERSANSGYLTNDHYTWPCWSRLQERLHSHMTNLSQSGKSLSSHWFRNDDVIPSLTIKLEEKSAGRHLKKVSSILKKDRGKTQPLFSLWILSFLFEHLKLIWIWAAFWLPPTWRWILPMDGWSLGPWWTE